MRIQPSLAVSFTLSATHKFDTDWRIGISLTVERVCSLSSLSRRSVFYERRDMSLFVSSRREELELFDVAVRPNKRVQVRNLREENGR